jgi:DNA-binding protein HU-beta
VTRIGIRQYEALRDEAKFQVVGRDVHQHTACEGNLMNKGELIEAVAAAADLTKSDATKAVEAFIDTVARTLRKGDQVSIVGFGNFAVKSRAARQGRNPKTGEPIAIPASRVPGFKAGKALKDAVN